MKLLKLLIVSVVFFGSIFFPSLVANAVVCFKSGELTSGMNKICFYDCLGSEAAITVSAVSLCPLTIDN